MLWYLINNNNNNNIYLLQLCCNPVAVVITRWQCLLTRWQWLAGWVASNIVFIQMHWRQDRILYILPDYSFCCELQVKRHGAGFCWKSW